MNYLYSPITLRQDSTAFLRSNICSPNKRTFSCTLNEPDVGFAYLIIEPDPKRPKFFDGGEGDPEAVAVFPCIACNHDVRVPLWEFLDRHLSWKHDRPPQQVSQLANLFRLKSQIIMDRPTYIGHGSRFPVIGTCDCDLCGHQLTVCISYDELSPLHYEAVIDGVAEWAPD